MTPGEQSLLRILAETADAAAAKARFHQAFPSNLSVYAFNMVVRNLSAKGLLCREGNRERRVLTTAGKAALAGLPEQDGTAGEAPSPPA